MGVGQDRHLSVTVNAPSGLLVSNVDDPKGQISFEVKETGMFVVYDFCGVLNICFCSFILETLCCHRVVQQTYWVFWYKNVPSKKSQIALKVAV